MIPNKPVDYKKRCFRLSFLLSVAVILLTITATVFVLFFKEMPILESIRYIRSSYYDFDDDNPKSFTNNVIKAIVYSLDDDYSDYYTKEQYEQLMQSKSGSYIGIGILLGESENGSITVLNVYVGSAAEKAGILPDDILISVDGLGIDGKSLSETVALFDFDIKTDYVLEIKRGEITYKAGVSVGNVNVPRVVCETLTDAIGYICISEFNGNAYQETKDCLKKLIEKGIEKLIIDLRDNPGGDFDTCLRISELFLNNGDTIVSTKSRKNKECIYYAEKDGIDIPTVILINGGTASASELMAAALHDNGRAYVVGTRSYGKGVVQTLFPLMTNGGRIKFTTDKYITPAGKCVQGEGIVPDLTIELDSINDSEGIKRDNFDLYVSAAIDCFEKGF